MNLKNLKEKLTTKSGKTIVTIVAIVVCIVIVYFAYKYRVDSKINPIDVPYALRKINAREEVVDDGKTIGIMKVAASMVTSTVVTNKQKIVGKFVNYNTYIPAGSLFYSNMLVEWKDMPDSTWADIPDDHTVVSLAVGGESTYGNSIFPGDYIDLYYKTQVDNNKLVFGKLIEGIRVLAVKDSNGKHIFKKGAGQRQAVALIFSVPEDLHLLFRQAIFISGDDSIVPVPRNANYTADGVVISSEYLRDLIVNETRAVPYDYIEEENTTDDNNINITQDNAGANVVE